MHLPPPRRSTTHPLGRDVLLPLRVRIARPRHLPPNDHDDDEDDVLPTPRSQYPQTSRRQHHRRRALPPHLLLVFFLPDHHPSGLAIQPPRIRLSFLHPRRGHLHLRLRQDAGTGVRHGRGGGAREEEIGEHRRRGGADLPRRTDATTASDGVDRHPHREQSPPQFAKRLGSKPAGQLVERLQGSQPTIQPGGRPTRHGRRHRLGPRLSLGAPPPHAPRSARRDRSGRRREEDAFPLGRFGRRRQRGRRSDRPAHQNGLLHPRSLPDVAGLSGIGTRRGTFGGDASR
mmetsp:Transcript_18825/g.39395  ORF Transcript_18825/g.39395 Transcript_18825/m.39395 type:complete len:287 (+) Transcript_18825:1318-2178(+)